MGRRLARQTRTRTGACLFNKLPELVSLRFGLLQGFLRFYPGAGVGKDFTEAHFNALNWNRKSNEVNWQTIFMLHRVIGYIMSVNALPLPCF
jgi:hypothetical protein